MPIPKPGNKEKEAQFIGRCMDNKTMKKEYGDDKQRLAVCYGSWRKAHGGKPPKKEGVLTMKLGNLCRVLKKLKRVESAKIAILAERLKKAPAYHFGSIVIKEKFNSLHDLLSNAVRAKFGKQYWMADFSSTEVIIRRETRDDGEVNAEGERVYQKVGFKIVNGEVEFAGDIKDVSRVVTYEDMRLETVDFVELTAMEVELKKQEKK